MFFYLRFICNGLQTFGKSLPDHAACLDDRAMAPGIDIVTVCTPKLIFFQNLRSSYFYQNPAVENLRSLRSYDRSRFDMCIRFFSAAVTRMGMASSRRQYLTPAYAATGSRFRQSWVNSPFGRNFEISNSCKISFGLRKIISIKMYSAAVIFRLGRDL